MEADVTDVWVQTCACGAIQTGNVGESPQPCAWCPPPVLPAEPTSRPLVYVYVHQLVCLLCGRPVVRVQLNAPRLPQVPPELRCQTCGGSVVYDGQVSRRLVIEPNLYRDLKPRRGRPPKALMEERRIA